MKKSQTSGAVWVAAAMLLLIVVLATYVTGYYLRGELLEVSSTAGGKYFARAYPTPIEVKLFTPAATIESALTRQNVRATHRWISLH